MIITLRAGTVTRERIFCCILNLWPKTILGGDIHLAVPGRFYTKPELGIPVEHNPRSMADVISSASTNRPPPEAITDLLARRNKIYHLDYDTHESPMKRFDKDRGNSNKTLRLKRYMGPIRGYAIMSASPLGSVGSIHANGHGINGDNGPSRTPTDGTKCKERAFPAASWRRRCRHGASCYKWNGRRHISQGLDVCFRVEVDHHDKEGRTEDYGFSSESRASK